MMEDIILGRGWMSKLQWKTEFERANIKCHSSKKETLHSTTNKNLIQTMNTDHIRFFSREIAIVKTTKSSLNSTTSR